MTSPEIRMEIEQVANHFTGEAAVRCEFSEITWPQALNVIGFIEGISLHSEPPEVIWRVFAQPGAAEYFGMKVPVTNVSIQADFTGRDDLVTLMKSYFGEGAWECPGCGWPWPNDEAA